jgi:Flp pilus assembly protein TadG
MVVIFGFVAFSVDIGYMKLARTQLQAAADAGARAGVLALGGGPSDAKLLAQDAAQDNRIPSPTGA